MNPLELLDKRVASAFYGRFHELRPAQEQAIEPLINGQNLVLSAGTGSGKTEAVTAPLISRYRQAAVEADSLTVIYIAPTKALVNDLEKRLTPLLSSIGLRVGIRHGDRDDLSKGAVPHLLITTPESLDVLLFRKDKSLADVKAVIIDEVHLLYNTQRGLHLSILLQRLKMILSGELQWAALSATVGNLSDIGNFLFDSTENTAFVQQPAHRSIDAKVLNIKDETDFVELIKKLTESTAAKLLLFANSRKECDRLASLLNQNAFYNVSVFAHYSSLSPELRIETEHQFAAAKTAVCVATSTLELGIDIGDIDAVLLWGVPTSVESFLQRIGRGNRRKNKTNVICLIPDQSDDITGDAVKFLTLVDAAKKGALPIRSPYNLYGAICQQFLSIIASEGGRFTRVADLCKIVEHKDYAGRPAVDTILAELAAKDYLKPHGFKNQYGASESIYKLQDYRMIYGNFPATSQSVEVYYKSKHLGTVPAVNLLRIRKGATVDFAGKRWQLKTASIDGIFLESSTQPANFNFTYSGSPAGFDSFLAQRIWELIHDESFSDADLSKPLRELVSSAKTTLNNVCGFHQIPFIRSQEGFRYFTFAGFLVNKAIALITNQVNYRADEFSILVNSLINWEAVPVNPAEYQSKFHLLFENNSSQSIFQTMLPPEFQIEEYLQEWLNDESIKKALIRLVNSEAVKIAPSDMKLFLGI